MSSSVIAVVLAAGLSSRMAPRNKMLLDIEGEPMARRSVRVSLGSLVAQVFVVVGHDRWNVRKVLAGLPVTIVENPDYFDAQMTSVRAGVLAAPEADGYLIVPGDMPLLTGEHLNVLLERFAELGCEKAVVPFADGERGNPIVIPGWSRTEMYRRGINFGCRNLLINFPEVVYPYETSDDAFFTDIDTPEAYAEVLARLAARSAA
jgi:molybdenum cofactor cytidylyltransferase